jgi:hypothetical protein
MIRSANLVDSSSPLPPYRGQSAGIFPDGDFRQEIVDDIISRVHAREFGCTVAYGVGPLLKVRSFIRERLDACPEGTSLSRDQRYDLTCDLAEIARVVLTTSGRHGGNSQVVPGVGFRLFWEPRYNSLRAVDGGLISTRYIEGEMHLSCPLWTRPIVGEACLYCGRKMFSQLTDAGAVMHPGISAEMVGEMLDAGARDAIFGVFRHGGYRRQLDALKQRIRPTTSHQNHFLKEGN